MPRAGHLVDCFGQGDIEQTGKSDDRRRSIRCRRARRIDSRSKVFRVSILNGFPGVIYLLYHLELYMVAKAKSQSNQRKARNAGVPHKPKTLLFRLRRTDSSSGVSAGTLKRLAEILDVPETQVIHQALRKLAEDFIPAYEADDGPVSDRMLEALKERVPQGRFKSVSSSLF